MAFHWWNDKGVGYGTPPKVGGFVTISSLVGNRIVKRRVSIRLAFDPNATSMSPIPGWTADDTRKAA